MATGGGNYQGIDLKFEINDFIRIFYSVFLVVMRFIEKSSGCQQNIIDCYREIVIDCNE